MVLKVSNGVSGNSWTFFEESTFSVEFVEITTQKAVSAISLCLLYEYPIEIPYFCHCAIWDGGSLHFNTQAYLLNANGKTIESFPPIRQNV